MTEEEKNTTLDDMWSLACEVRGTLIEKFTNIERLMDLIIKETAFDNKEDYFKYVNENLKGEMGMSTKKALFKKCVEKHENKFNETLADVVVKLDTLVDQRNKLAHWAMDTSEEGIKLYRSKEKLRLMTFDKNDIKLEAYFNLTEIKKLDNQFNDVSNALAHMVVNLEGQKLTK